MSLYYAVTPNVRGIDFTSKPPAQATFFESEKAARAYAQRYTGHSVYTCEITGEQEKRMKERAWNEPGIGKAMRGNVIRHTISHVETSLPETYLHPAKTIDEAVELGKVPEYKKLSVELGQREYDNKELAELLARSGLKTAPEAQRNEVRDALSHNGKLRNPQERTFENVAYSRMACMVVQHGTLEHIAQEPKMREMFDAMLKATKTSPQIARKQFQDRQAIERENTGFERERINLQRRAQQAHTEAERQQIEMQQRKLSEQIKKFDEQQKVECDAYNKFLAEIASYSSPMNEIERVGLAMTGTLSAMAAAAPSAAVAHAYVKTQDNVRGIIDEASRATETSEKLNEPERNTREYSEAYKDADGDGISNIDDPYKYDPTNGLAEQESTLDIDDIGVE